MQPLIITLDGPAGSGKSTVARLLARRLGLEFLDTGAMYRGIAAWCLQQSIDCNDQARVVELARAIDIRFDWTHDPPQLTINGHDLTRRLRDPDVTAQVSAIAGMPEVRQILVELQRQIGRQHPRLVTEGRDQGSVVFPDAQVKFYLDADPAVRARRRAQELQRAGKGADEKQILEQILRRDSLDSSRAEGPLVCPSDAIRIDTSPLTLDQVVDLLEETVRRRLAPEPDRSSSCSSTTGEGCSNG